ncbi:hypothetical protein BaRGS_00023791 [Batillaria attramentaria]|uniref:Uncharacterized protein n=1 Tax=Batillaria attramentaria TaxID=370345 RepID=A0ABD0KD45_9CAEN
MIVSVSVQTTSSSPCPNPHPRAKAPEACEQRRQLTAAGVVKLHTLDRTATQSRHRWKVKRMKIRISEQERGACYQQCLSCVYQYLLFTHLEQRLQSVSPFPISNNTLVCPCGR